MDEGVRPEDAADTAPWKVSDVQPPWAQEAEKFLAWLLVKGNRRTGTSATMVAWTPSWHHAGMKPPR